MTPDFKEAPISQIPALRLLQQLGYSYLGPEEVAVERKGRLGRVILEDILLKQLRRLNRISFKGREVAFSEENLAKAVEALRDLPPEGLVKTSEKVYDLLTLGKSLDQTIDGETKGFTLRYIDWENPRNNTFHVTAEYEVERTGSHETRRPDIVGFVNGIPFFVTECKRPDLKHSLEQAVNQSVRNQEEDEIPHLFHYAQLVLALNKNEGSYATTGTQPKFWAKWREIHDVTDAVRAAVNSPVRPEEHTKLFKGMFAFAKTDFEEHSLAGREPTGQDHLLWSLCRPERLIEIARQFILYDEGGTVKKVARYQQYFAIRSTVERVRQRDRNGRRKGGVIWQTQGSGKSLAMVLLGKALALEKNIPNARISKFSGDNGWFEAVERDQVDALIYDYPFAAEEIKTHPRTTIVQYNLNQSKYAVGIPAGNFDLVYEINQAIDRFRATPQYGDLMREYLSSASEVFTKPVAGRKTYTVKAGDTLSKIAQAQLNDSNRWREIWDLNKERVANENLIYPRLVLLMP